ncbi:MAG TPA: hypothetical protein VKE69_01465 [Planctomycetota bacterium]|nr:hypothetical protein [Planctomycetota bacterium]
MGETEDDRLLRAACGLASLPEETVASFEARLHQDPSDLDARAQLIGHHTHVVRSAATGFVSDAKRAQRESASRRLEEHATWCIEHCPTRSFHVFAGTSLDRDAGARLAAAWDKAIDASRGEPRVIENAVHFHRVHDARRAVELTEQSRARHPDDARWPRILAELAVPPTASFLGKADPEALRKQKALWSDALRLETDPSQRRTLLQRKAATALELEEHEEAEALAAQCREESREEPQPLRGLRARTCRGIEGEAALKRGDVEAAKRHLEASLDDADPQDKRPLFAPMRLAHALYERGETDVVLRFLERCVALGPQNRDQLFGWRACVAEGKPCSFGLTEVALSRARKTSPAPEPPAEEREPGDNLMRVAAMASLRGLTDEEISKWRDRLAQAPDDLEARATLMGGLGRKNEREAVEHRLWLIRNRPDHPLSGMPAYYPSSRDAIERAWSEAIEAHPNDARVLGNAAQSCGPVGAGRERAIGLYRRARAIDATNPKWPDRLSFLGQLEVQSPRRFAAQRGQTAPMKPEERAALVEARALLEEAFAKSDPASPERHWRLTRLASLAFDLDELETARRHALELEAHAPHDSCDHANALHVGHQLLGRLALRAGDVADAERRLLASVAEIPERTALRWIGPSWDLANDLLAADRTDAVLEFLRVVESFWNRPAAEEIPGWRAAIAEGRRPFLATRIP